MRCDAMQCDAYVVLPKLMRGRRNGQHSQREESTLLAVHALRFLDLVLRAFDVLLTGQPGQKDSRVARDPERLLAHESDKTLQIGRDAVAGRKTCREWWKIKIWAEGEPGPGHNETERTFRPGASGMSAGKNPPGPVFLAVLELEVGVQDPDLCTIARPVS